ncbi:rod shape-determining protein RodA [Salinactinospora qingdaonensis]|uniref:peptidoglycan glycosyltransferase n=1 Tax=Salinactinospora qingdaonensis TaxID=702744 RepID=A0ABP7EYI5_9ACTN
MPLFTNTQVDSGAPWVVRTALLIAGTVPRRLDWALVAAVAVLSIVSTLLVWSATAGGADPSTATEFLRRHLLHLCIGAVACLTVAAIDYRAPRAYAPILYTAGMVGLALVLTPLGSVVNGSRSWLEIGVFQAQPGEVAKIALILAVAMLLGEPNDGEHAPTSRDVLFSLAALAVPMGLILAQPDLGTAMVFAVVYLGMLTLSGAPLRWGVGVVLSGVAAIAAVLWLGLLEDYQIQRFTSFADPSADPRGAGYNANQALIAIGSGGFNGTGLFQGEQTSGEFVPEQHTDFIFTVAGEELGFLGSAAIIALIGFVIWRILRVAASCPHPYGRLVCAGVAAWFAFQSFVNIGMTLGLMPITGLPLPLLSYGGTATIAQLTAIGLVLAIQGRAHSFD